MVQSLFINGIGFIHQFEKSLTHFCEIFLLHLIVVAEMEAEKIQQQSKYFRTQVEEHNNGAEQQEEEPQQQCNTGPVSISQILNAYHICIELSDASFL